MRIVLILIGLLSSQGSLALERIKDVVLSPTSLVYNGPADSITPGTVIGSNWSATVFEEQVFWCGNFYFCTKGTMEPSPEAIYSGISVIMDGGSYAVFETGIPGIGYIIGMKDYKATTYIPLQNSLSQNYPAEGSNQMATKLGWAAKVTFIKTGSALKSGVYQTPAIDAAKLTAYNNEIKTAKVIINPTTITVNASGCVVATPALNVSLGTIDIRTLKNIGSTSKTGSFNITLECDSDIAIKAVVTDQTTPSNTSNTLTLTGDSTASGVGVQFLYNGTGPLMLGPDSSNEGTTNQFFIKNTPSVQQILVLPFQAQYVRTGPLVPGTANALASITFSYQ